MKFYTRLALLCVVYFFVLSGLLWWFTKKPSHKIRNTIPPPLHTLAILVPFRDRFDELMVFLPHMYQFLKKQNISHRFYILNQVDSFRFNRASLLNAGSIQARDDGCDYLVLHDVDLLPLNSALSYAYPKSGAVHLSSPKLHPRYHYKTYMGGVLLITQNDFRTANGMSNVFWGWGREDDEFRLRLLDSKIQINEPENIATGFHTFRHFHSAKRFRDMQLYFNQRKMTFKRDIFTGLNSVVYDITSRHNLTVDSVTAEVLDIRLICDESVTPYCVIPPVS